MTKKKKKTNKQLAEEIRGLLLTIAKGEGLKNQHLDLLRLDVFVDDRAIDVDVPILGPQDFDEKDILRVMFRDGELPHCECLVTIEKFGEKVTAAWRKDAGRYPYVRLSHSGTYGDEVNFCRTVKATKANLDLLHADVTKHLSDADPDNRIDIKAEQQVQQYRLRHGDKKLAQLIKKFGE